MSDQNTANHQFKKALSQNDLSSSSAAHAAGGVEIDLRRVLMTFWRHRYLIVIMMALFIMGAYYISGRITPLYRTSALVLIQQEKLDVQNISAAQFLNNERVDTTQILSEVEVIRSRNILLQVINNLKLYQDPAYTYDLPYLRKFHQIEASEERKQGFKSFNLNSANQDGAVPLMTNDEKWRYERELGILISRIAVNLEIRPVPGSMVIAVKYVSPSAERAKQVVDMVADVYVNDRLNRKFAATRKVSAWLDSRLDILREQLREAESAVEKYRGEKELISGARAEITAQQISEVNSQLVVSKTRLAEAKAKLDNIRGWADRPVKIESAMTLGDGNVLGTLILKQGTIEQEYSDLSKRYGEKHPEMIRVRGALENIRAEIKKELERTAEHLENNMSVEKRRTEVLSENLRELEEKRKEENQAAIHLRELQGEAESIRQIFMAFLESYKRSDSQEDLQEADAQVLSYASVPLNPFHPNVKLFMALSAILGLFVAIGLIVLIENLDNTYRSALQIERDTGLRCIGTIPVVKVNKNRRIADYIFDNPNTVTTEALRSLKTVLTLNQRHMDKPLDVLGITSSLPGEGKSTLALWMARLNALSGKRVLLIDCDLRRPNIHNLMGYKNNLSLVEYLTGQMPLEDVICQDERTGLDIILGRSVANTALDLLSSDKMVDLMTRARTEYDLVVLDTPASLAVSDPCILAEYSDHMVYCVHWDGTPREIVLSGIKQFKDLGFTNLSLAFSLVDLRRQAKYGYGETAYYYTHYTEEEA